jgi:hypothetical protein
MRWKNTEMYLNDAKEKLRRNHRHHHFSFSFLIFSKLQKSNMSDQLSAT